MAEPILTYQDLKQVEEYITDLYDATNLKSETYLDVLKAVRDYINKYDLKPTK